MSAVARRPAALLSIAVISGACRAPDPRTELDIRELETYWAVDPSVGNTQYMAPAVRFRVFNKGAEPQRSVQATATFRRAGEEAQTWGSAWLQVTSRNKPLEPGKDALIMLKSDARYYSTGSPDSMFEHKLFKDARVEVFLRIGASGWVRFAEAPVGRRIGSKTVRLAGP